MKRKKNKKQYYQVGGNIQQLAEAAGNLLLPGAGTIAGTAFNVLNDIIDPPVTYKPLQANSNKYGYQKGRQINEEGYATLPFLLQVNTDNIDRVKKYLKDSGYEAQMSSKFLQALTSGDLIKNGPVTIPGKAGWNVPQDMRSHIKFSTIVEDLATKSPTQETPSVLPSDYYVKPKGTYPQIDKFLADKKQEQNILRVKKLQTARPVNSIAQQSTAVNTNNFVPSLEEQSKMNIQKQREDNTMNLSEAIKRVASTPISAVSSTASDLLKTSVSLKEKIKKVANNLGIDQNFVAPEFLDKIHNEIVNISRNLDKTISPNDPFIEENIIKTALKTVVPVNKFADAATYVDQLTNPKTNKELLAAGIFLPGKYRNIGAVFLRSQDDLKTVEKQLKDLGASTFDIEMFLSREQGIEKVLKFYETAQTPTEKLRAEEVLRKALDDANNYRKKLNTKYGISLPSEETLNDQLKQTLKQRNTEVSADQSAIDAQKIMDAAEVGRNRIVLDAATRQRSRASFTDKEGNAVPFYQDTPQNRAPILFEDIMSDLADVSVRGVKRLNEKVFSAARDEFDPVVRMKRASNLDADSDNISYESVESWQSAQKTFENWKPQKSNQAELTPETVVYGFHKSIQEQNKLQQMAKALRNKGGNDAQIRALEARAKEAESIRKSFSKKLATLMDITSKNGLDNFKKLYTDGYITKEEAKILNNDFKDVMTNKWKHFPDPKTMYTYDALKGTPREIEARKKGTYLNTWDINKLDKFTEGLPIEAATTMKDMYLQKEITDATLPVFHDAWRFYIQYKNLPSFGGTKRAASSLKEMNKISILENIDDPVTKQMFLDIIKTEELKSYKKTFKPNRRMGGPLFYQKGRQITHLPYKIKKGDTLYSIAKKYTKDDLANWISEIKRMNNLKSDLIREGQELILPINVNIKPPHLQQVKTPKSYFINKQEYQQGGQHTVQNGETLWGLSQLYNISVDELKALNNLHNNIILPGQSLRLKEVSVGSNNTPIEFETQKSKSKVQPSSKYYLLDQETGQPVRRVGDHIPDSYEFEKQSKNVDNLERYAFYAREAERRKNIPSKTNYIENIDRPLDSISYHDYKKEVAHLKKLYLVKDSETYNPERYKKSIANLNARHKRFFTKHIAPKMLEEQDEIETKKLQERLRNQKVNRELGGPVPEELQPIQGGDIIPIEQNGYNVVGDNSMEIDGIETQAAHLDDGEHIRTDINVTGEQSPGFVYSNTLKVPGTKETFAKAAEKLSRILAKLAKKPVLNSADKNTQKFIKLQLDKLARQNQALAENEEKEGKGMYLKGDQMDYQTGSQINYKPFDSFNPIMSGADMLLNQQLFRQPVESLSYQLPLADIQWYNQRKLAQKPTIYDDKIYDSEIPQQTSQQTLSQNKLGQILQIGALAGKGLSLLRGPQKEQRSFASSPITQQYYDPSIALQNNQRSFSNLQNYLNSNLGTAPARTASLNAAYANLYNTNANTLSQYQTMNRQARNNYEQQLAQREGQNINLRNQYNDLDSRNEAAFWSQGIDPMFTSIANLGREYESQRTNRRAVEMFLQAFPDIAKFYNPVTN